MAKKKKEEVSDKEEELDPAAEEGAAESEEGQEGEQPAAKKSKKKLIIIAVILLVLIGGGVAGFLLMSGKSEEHKEEEIALDEHGNPVNNSVYYTLPQFLVNLNATGKSQVFLKTTVILEVGKQSDIPYIESNMPRLVDGINTYLRELRSSDLAGSAGIQRLREEILLRVNKTIAPVEVKDVLFKEIIVQ